MIIFKNRKNAFNYSSIESISIPSQAANQNHIDVQYILGAIFSHNPKLTKNQTVFLKWQNFQVILKLNANL